MWAAVDIDAAAAAAEAAYVLPRFIQGVSPGRRVRAAAGRPGAWTNVYPESLSAEQATIGRPVTVYLTRWSRKGRGPFVLPVFDLDASSAGRSQVRADAAALTRALAAHGIQCVPVISGPTGGMHLWAACPEGLDAAVVARIAQAAKRLYPSLDTTPLTNSATGAVRPPGSLHRAGGYARLTEHTVEEAVAVLRQGAARSAWTCLLGSLEAMANYPALLSESRVRAAGPQLAPVRHGGQPIPPSIAARGGIVRPVTTDGTGRIKLDRPWQPLSAKALATLCRRPQDQPDAHRHAVHVPVRNLALAGGTYQQLRDLIADEELSPALEWLRTASTPGGGRVPLTHVEASRRAERVWWLAVQDAARLPKRPADDGDTPRQDTPGALASAELAARIEAVGPDYWARPSGASDRNLLYSVAFRMEFSGAAEVSADVRGLGVLMGRSKSTAAASMSRVVLDGWLRITSASDAETFTARRVALADSHECPDSPHHLCAVHDSTAASQKTPGQSGSDGYVNTPPPATGRGFPSEAISPVVWRGRLGDRIAFQQSGLWTAVGHTVARTLEALEAGVSVAQLTTATGYGPATISRHLSVLVGAGILAWSVNADGTQSAIRTSITLYEAAAQYGTATRPGERAMAAYVDRVRWAWCLREAAYCRLSLPAKRDLGPRLAADQPVPEGFDPYERAYPRTSAGDFDHAAAWRIEALRTGALAIALQADALARAGRPVDPARLKPATPQQAAEDDHQAAGAAA